MLLKLDRYLLRNNLGLLAALLALALSILMLERLIRITDLVAGSDDALMSGARMVGNLLPHYLGVALPGALMIATLISVERLSRSGEIVALMSTGVSLYRIVRPYMVLAVVLTVVSLVISGFLQPLTRYNYREIVHELKQSAVVTAFKERKFVQFEGRVVWTSKVDLAGRNMGSTFIVETTQTGERRFLTGRSGALHEDATGTWVITLNDAMVGQVPAQIADGQGHRLTTGKVTWKMPTPIAGYRDRGDDEQELTLPELMTRSYLTGPFTIDPVAAAADMHDRLSRAVLLLALPLVSVVLGLNTGRMARAGGLAMGIVVLLMVQKLLEYGLTLAQRGTVPTWAGSWPIVALVAFGGIYTFRRIASGRSALPRLRHHSAPPPPSPETAVTAAK
ncbi:lipopolysaccharide export system permease protein [Rhodobacteraceae bacterium MBR-64]|jgi:lipopolysaccharide export system permease protein